MALASLAELPVTTVIPVSDLERSRSFYEQTLGLSGREVPGGHLVVAGSGTAIYLLAGTTYAGLAGWPLASFQAEDLAMTVSELSSRGVVFDQMHDDPPWRTDERGIADFGDMLIAWFRDPDGQVLSVVQRR